MPADDDARVGRQGGDAGADDDGGIKSPRGPFERRNEIRLHRLADKRVIKQTRSFYILRDNDQDTE